MHERHRLLGAHGAGRADARRPPYATRLGSCRDSAWLLVSSALRDAAWPPASSPATSSSSTADVEALEGPAGPKGTSPTCTPGPRCSCPAPAGSALTPRPGLFAGEGHIPLSATPAPVVPRRRSPARPPRWRATMELLRTPCAGCTRMPRVDPAVHAEQWTAVDDLGVRVDAALSSRRRPADHGRRAHLRLGATTPPTPDSGASRRDGEDKRRVAPAAGRADWRRGTPRRRGAPRPGQVVPRRTPAALADRRSPGALTVCRCGRTGTARRTPGRADTRPTARRRPDRRARPGGRRRRRARHQPALTSCPPTRTPWWTSPPRRSYPVGERRPEDLDPDDPALADEQGRARRWPSSRAARASPRGWVVPMLRLARTSDRWATTTWRTRRRHLYLTPGTSPMGLRLPLSRWPGPGRRMSRTGRRSSHDRPAADRASDGESPPAAALRHRGRTPRTALCVEEREGHLFVFLPPLTELEDAVELLSVVETAASAIELPVVLEGYPPAVRPADDRRCR